MPVISFASSKGGAGKTTSCIILGSIISESASVTMIDADPAQRLVSWSKKSPLPDNISVRGGVTEDNIMDVIQEARETSRMVLVDLEGVFSRLNTFALLKSSLVIVPMGDEQQDADAAVTTLAQVRRDGMSAGREIPARILFARTKAAVKSTIARRINAAMRENVPCLTTELCDRSSYSVLHNMGGTLQELREAEKVGRLDQALDNAYAFAGEVFDILTEQQGTKV